VLGSHFLYRKYFAVRRSESATRQSNVQRQELKKQIAIKSSTWSLASENCPPDLTQNFLKRKFEAPSSPASDDLPVHAPRPSDVGESRSKILIYSNCSVSHQDDSTQVHASTFQPPVENLNIMAPCLEEVEDAVSALPVETTSKRIDGVEAIQTLKLEEDEKHGLVLGVYRCLIADLCEQFKGGHPGYDLVFELACNLLTSCRGAMSMAAIGISLWKYAMKYAPTDPSYFNRDRFVLSNGMIHS
jgi:hypothetical protein